MCVVAYVRGRIKVPTHGLDVKRAYRAISSTPLDKSVESFGSVDSFRCTGAGRPRYYAATSISSSTIRRSGVASTSQHSTPSAAYFGTAAVYFDTVRGPLRLLQHPSDAPDASTTPTLFGCSGCFDYSNTFRMLRLLRLLQHSSNA